MKEAITITFCFIAGGTAIFFWMRFTPDKTPEQVRADTYYRCVQRLSVERGDVSSCNDIR